MYIDRSLVTCFAWLTCFGWVGALHAEEKGKNPAIKVMFDNGDKDKDGRLTLAEWRLKKTLFQQLDTNKDEYLTLVEAERKSELIMAALGQDMYDVPFATRLERTNVVEFDLDHDGMISEPEYRAWLFAAAAGDDGAIDVDEADSLSHFGMFNKEFAGEGARVLDRFDKNKDARIEATEWKPTDAEFKSHDRDRSGKLTADELDYREPNAVAAIANQSVDTVMEKFDKNKNGKIEKGEAGGTLGEVLGRFDGDSDGATDRGELDRALKTAQDVQFASIDTDFIGRYDLNNDKKVSRKEFPGTDAVFLRIDRNRDGFVTKSDSAP